MRERIVSHARLLNGYFLLTDPTSTVPSDYLPPVLVTDEEAARKVRQSTVSLSALVAGQVARDQIELAFSRQGCGAVLVQLDQRNSDIYETFYRLQWQLGTCAFGSVTEARDAAARFAALDLPVRQLLCECGVGVARARVGLSDPISVSPEDLTKFLLTGARPLSAAVGRPLAANRQEFHPCVDWLIAQEEAGYLRRDENPSLEVVAFVNNQAGAGQILGRAQADEAQLLALHREWMAASPEERRGHGNKFNGNVYYGAFRGHTHLDSGGTMTVLFGPGEVRDCAGCPADDTTNSRELGGTLMVAVPVDETFTPLPYRLPCSSPYVVVFFEEVPKLPTPPVSLAALVQGADGGTGYTGVVRRQYRRPDGINANALGWAATAHGVRRIENPRFSRGQTVVHLLLADGDLA